MQNFSEKVSFIWSVADLIRDVFKRSKYQDVILPFTVLRRIDSVMADSREAVRETYAKYSGRIENPDDLLRNASGFAFYNVSPYDFETLLGDPKNLALNLKKYIQDFSENMREVLDKFEFSNTIDKLAESNLLFMVLERFTQIDLHPDRVSNLEMGYIFEELIRKFNEATNENPGEHFTPREVVELMVELVLIEDIEQLSASGVIPLIYDPCCGTGGMLTVAKNRIYEMNPAADVRLYGQEVNGETFAVCKSDLYMKSADGKDAENIKFGSTLSEDKHADKRFDYMLANPPYGKDWKKDSKDVEKESDRGYAGRFGAGTPRINDGQLLFLQHMIGRMRSIADGGSRIADITNGSPLFTGDAGSGESEIRRWILENDWLEAIVALPEQLFYNTGIATYVWVLTNRKPAHRKGKVQLIDATSFWVSMRKSLGDKRREIAPENRQQIVELFEAFEDNDYSKIFDNEDFGYRKVTIERPLRLNFHAIPERIERLYDETAFANIAKSKKRDPEAKAAEEAAGHAEQERIIAMLQAMPDTLYKNRQQFRKDLKRLAKAHDIKLTASLGKAIEKALSEQDETSDMCKDKNGNSEPDSSLRDYEYVPLKDDIDDYFEREVLPHVPDAWIDDSTTDHKDNAVGRVGYEINFNRYFYKYQPPRPLDEIEADIRKLEREIIDMLRDVTE